MNNTEPLLQVRHLTKEFRDGFGRKRVVVRAVEDVTFDVNRAEVFGLVGESGCGKTTTGRMILRLEKPSSGTVTFDGRLISGQVSRETRSFVTRNISMVFQDPVESLNPRMTVEEIVGEGLRLQGISRQEVHSRVIAILNRVGLTEEHAGRYPHEFSGGQRQRIGIARAVICQPRMIIADEPVSALDVSVQAQVINLLSDLKKEMGLTVLFIAHNLSVVKYFSDRVGVMYKGRLVEVAPSDELYRCPLHPYTQALLSAIPQPNPLTERRRKRVEYVPAPGAGGFPLAEVSPGHLVSCSEGELQQMKRTLETAMVRG